MSLPNLIMLVSFSALLASGQVGFKYAADHIKVRNFAEHGLFAYVSVPLIASLALYAFATVLWIYILTKVPLSRAYPFALLGAAIVPVAAHFLFSEQIGITYWVGFPLILAGLYLCVR